MTAPNEESGTGAESDAGAEGDRDADWDSEAYDGSHAFVYEYGADVLDLLDPQPGERILDLGCGTGHLTERIADAGADVVGIDQSAEMVETARETYPELDFHRADARYFDVHDFDVDDFDAGDSDRSGPFDAVFSNAVLHWIDDQDAVLDSVTDALRPGGRFVAELGGSGNVAAIVDAVRAELDARGYEPPSAPWYFPTVGEHATTLEAHGFEVRYARLFDRPTELDDGEDGMANWLGMFGDRLLGAVPADERPDVVAAVEDRLREDLYDDGVWTADYRRLRFVAVLE
ncbi:class I SAM-dependent methyltransferase [Halobellus limi]|uniref:Methyltransferase domain-containing protein n=1 Tax=Halobellus limi TaxID=699433 RepID=A0A1H5ZAF4_9EURY|nr:methyltransferase [Halobellus limi]QCC48157.1 methyltransferase domain-containing protein [Halobellus limi]SEG33513.1 Methyltransferase domain-containing protein [Halobellus limi]